MSTGTQAAPKDTVKRAAPAAAKAAPKPQAAPTPAPAAKKPQEPDKNDKNARAHKAFSGVIAGISVFLLMTALMLGAVALIYFDVGGIKPTVASALGLYDDLNEKAFELDKRATALDQLQSEQDQEKVELERARAQIEADQAALEQLKEEFEIQQALETGAQTDIEKTAQTFDEMDPAKAAAIISAMGDTTETLQIMKNVSPEAFARIMEEMDPVLAAKILSKVFVNTNG